MTRSRTRERNGIIAGVVGGLIYGYTSGAIAGSLAPIEASFHVGSVGQSIVAAALLVGGLVGAAVSSRLVRRSGDRHIVVVGALVGALGSIACGLVPTSSIAWLTLMRFVVGIGIGLLSVAAPSYIAQLASNEVRGRLVSTFQLMITVGILASYIVGFIFESVHDGWRYIMILGAIPCIAAIWLGMRAQETPDVLVRSGRKDEAVAILEHTHPASATAALASLELSGGDLSSRGRWRELTTDKNRTALKIALVMASAQILTGINVIMYYAPVIFKQAGFKTATQAIIGTIIVGVVNVLATLIAVRFVDRYGRRPLLMIGLSGMLVSALGVAASFFLDSTSIWVSILTVGFTLLFVCSFAMSLGPLAWVVINEVFAPDVREVGVSVSLVTNWVCNVALSLTFLMIIAAIGGGMTFLIFAALTLATLIFVKLRVAETKGDH